MNTKEKLTEIIGNVVVNDKGNRIRDVFHPEFVEKIVADLLLNGAETPTHCCECKYCEKFVGIIENPLFFCGFWDENPEVDITDYCSFGKRKENEDGKTI